MPTYATWDKTLTYAGNLRYSPDGMNFKGGTARQIARSTFGQTAGKWYVEMSRPWTYNNASNGIVRADSTGAGYVGSVANSMGQYSIGDVLKAQAGSTGIGAVMSNFVVQGFLIDLDMGTIRFYFDGVNAGGTFAITGWSSGSEWFLAAGPVDDHATFSANFGATPFVYPSIATGAGANLGWYV